MVNPRAVVGRGTSLSRREQGLVILGALVGHVEFVKAQLEKKAAEHSVLLQRIPLVENLQAAWLRSAVRLYPATHWASWATPWQWCKGIQRIDSRGELDAPHRSDVNQQPPTVPVLVSSC